LRYRIAIHKKTSNKGQNASVQQAVWRKLGCSFGGTFAYWKKCSLLGELLLSPHLRQAAGTLYAIGRACAIKKYNNSGIILQKITE
jgi:hypothetical protein